MPIQEETRAALTLIDTRLGCLFTLFTSSSLVNFQVNQVNPPFDMTPSPFGLSLMLYSV